MASSTKKVTVHLPSDTLENAQKITGKGITPTILEGLRELERKAKREALRNLRGKVHVDVRLGETRR